MGSLLDTRAIGLENKIMLYTTLIRPMMTYAYVVWLTAAKTNLEFLEAVQSKILRRRNTQIRTDLQLPSVREHIAMLAEKSITRARESTNVWPDGLIPITPWLYSG